MENAAPYNFARHCRTVWRQKWLHGSQERKCLADSAQIPLAVPHGRRLKTLPAYIRFRSSVVLLHQGKSAGGEIRIESLMKHMFQRFHGHMGARPVLSSESHQQSDSALAGVPVLAALPRKNCRGLCADAADHGGILARPRRWIRRYCSPQSNPPPPP